MEYAFVVNGFQALQDANENRDAFFRRKSAMFPQMRLEGLAFEKGHGQKGEGAAVGTRGLAGDHMNMQPEFQHPADVGVGDFSSHDRFLTKTSKRRGVVAPGTGECFQGDGLVQKLIVGLVNLAHPTRGDKGQDPITSSDDHPLGQVLCRRVVLVERTADSARSPTKSRHDGQLSMCARSCSDSCPCSKIWSSSASSGHPSVGIPLLESGGGTGKGALDKCLQTSKVGGWAM